MLSRAWRFASLKKFPHRDTTENDSKLSKGPHWFQSESKNVFSTKMILPFKVSRFQVLGQDRAQIDQESLSFSG